MPTTKLPDNGHTASQKISLQRAIPFGPPRTKEVAAEPLQAAASLGLHRQIHDALETRSFKRNAAGKTGEDLKMTVAAAIATNKISVEIISVGLADAAEL